jgi:hypothetical protein
VTATTLCDAASVGGIMVLGTAILLMIDVIDDSDVQSRHGTYLLRKRDFPPTL